MTRANFYSDEAKYCTACRQAYRGRCQNYQKQDEKIILENMGREMYATIRKRPYVPSVRGIKIICNVYAEGLVNFVKHLQRSQTR